MKSPDKISLAEKFDRNPQKELQDSKDIQMKFLWYWECCFSFHPSCSFFLRTPDMFILYLYLSKVRTSFSGDCFHLCFHLICCNEKGGVSRVHLSSWDTKISMLAPHFCLKLWHTQGPGTSVDELFGAAFL